MSGSVLILRLQGEQMSVLSPTKSSLPHLHPLSHWHIVYLIFPAKKKKNSLPVTPQPSQTMILGLFVCSSIIPETKGESEHGTMLLSFHHLHPVEYSQVSPILKKKKNHSHSPASTPVLPLLALHRQTSWSKCVYHFHLHTSHSEIRHWPFSALEIGTHILLSLSFLLHLQSFRKCYLHSAYTPLFL